MAAATAARTCYGQELLARSGKKKNDSNGWRRKLIKVHRRKEGVMHSPSSSQSPSSVAVVSPLTVAVIAPADSKLLWPVVVWLSCSNLYSSCLAPHHRQQHGAAAAETTFFPSHYHSPPFLRVGRNRVITYGSVSFVLCMCIDFS